MSAKQQKKDDESKATEEEKDPYAKYILMDFKHWTLLLHEHQYPYIGRCVVAAKRKEADVLTDGTLEEYTELHMKIIPLWVSAAQSLYKMDRPNLSILGNKWNHLHAHLIPRFHSKRTFHNIEFIDPNPTGFYVPYQHKDIGDKITDCIIQEMKQELQKKKQNIENKL